MTRLFTGLSLCLLLAVGCSKTGSTSTERTQNDSTTAKRADSTLTATPPASLPAMPVNEPDAPSPSPTGWKPFDEYFKQLEIVHHTAIEKGIVVESEVAELGKRAKLLAADTVQNPSLPPQPPTPMRRMLLETITQLEHLPKDPPIQQLEFFRRILQFTEDMILGSNPDPEHQRKINNMLTQIIYKIAEVQAAGPPPKK